MAVRGDVLNEFLDLLETEFLVRHFTAAKTQGHLDLHFFTKKINRMTELHAKVVWID